MQSYTFTYLICVCLTLLGSGSLEAQARIPGSGRAILSGQQQVYPVATSASGAVNVDLTPKGRDSFTVVVTGNFGKLSSPVATNISNGAHIHIAYPGRNGGIIMPLKPTLRADSLGGSFVGADNTFTLSTKLLESTDVGAMYVNIHTRNYPMGEIRGNVIRVGQEPYFTNLLGSNQVPSVVSNAFGAVVLAFDPITNKLVVSGSFGDLSDTLATSVGGGAHLHIGLPGRNGAVRFPLKATQDEDRRGGIFVGNNNVFTLTAEDVTALRAGNVYVNIHSGTYPAGEIRGQVLPPADALLRAHLSGANDWPVVTSGASGQVFGHVTGNILRIVGTFNDLESSIAVAIRGGAHLHTGIAGQNGPIIIDLKSTLSEDSLSGVFALADNQYTLTDAQKTALLERGIYLNIHSLEHPTGEIRGQMLPESQAVFTAFLNGNQQIPAVLTAARGMVKVEKMGNRMTATGSFLNLGSPLATQIAMGAHLHAGYPGQNGPVIFPLTSEFLTGSNETSGKFLPTANTFTVSDGAIDTLTNRFFYVNVHSDEYNGGEIRGSVLAEAESYFLAPLSGASQPEGVPTDASGMVAIEVTDTVLHLVGSFKELGSEFASEIQGGMHLHRAIAGSNGGILFPINTEITDDSLSGEVLVDSNLLRLTMAQYTDLRQRLLYLNIHTDEYRAGEIRGQILPLAGTYFHTTFSGANATNYVATTAKGGLKLELIDSTLTLSGSVTNLDGNFDASIAGGAHLHLAAAGQNGPIIIPIVSDTTNGLKNVTFQADSNRYQLTADQTASLYAGLLYANVHTTVVPSGEARGQIRGEINFAPDASSILSPMSGDSLNLAGAADQAFRVSYSPTTDVDGDTVIYVWQLSTTEAFDTILFAMNTGRDTFFETDFGTVDTLLATNGIAEGATTTLYHRVLASDGSNYRPSAPSTITLTRNLVVGTSNYLPEGFSGRVFPNPARAGAPMTYEVKTDEAFSGRLLVYTQLGQLQQEIAVEAAVGTQRFELRTNGLAGGQYFVTLRDRAGNLIQATQVVVR